MWVYHRTTLRFLDVNDAAVAKYGYARDEFLAMTITDLRPSEDMPKVMRALEQLPSGGPFRVSGQWRHRLRDGRLIDIEITSHDLDFGGVPARLVVTHDLADRKLAERARSTTERIFETSQDLILVVDRTGNFVQVSPSSDAILGYRPDELVGRNAIDFLYSADLESTREQMRQARRGGTKRTFETRYVHKDGRIVTLTWTGVWSEADQRHFFIGRDMTAHKQAEEEIRRLNEELEERVRRRTAELTAANRELEAFSYSVSHDLRAPLRAIDGFSRLLQEDLADQLTDDGRHLVQVVRQNAQQMGQLIDDLLAFSRLGRQAPKMEPVSLKVLAERIILELQAEYAGRKIDFSVGDLGVVQADPALLKQALANLISNAIKFTRGTESAAIEIGRRDQNSDGTAYYVKDNGTGFDERYAGKLFQVFQRLHRPEDYEGTGVGLAIVKRVIDHHGGRVWAESKLGNGATFFFTLR